jgi:deoxyguanosine kinase
LSPNALKPRPEEYTLRETNYIAIEGPIGVGKTTLARLLHKEFDGELLLEVFEENPFLSSFYADRAKYAFQTQIFFLLSRYRQQHQVVNRVLQHSSLVSDYVFAKDRLFARLNLAGDELAVYETLHGLLAEKIALPDLVVYMKADLEVLLERIAIRDRTYERTMSREYMTDLARAYEAFFSIYNQAPILTIDTNTINIVRNAGDLADVVSRIREALGAGSATREALETPAQERSKAVFEGRRRRLSDLQQWSRLTDQENGAQQDPYHDYVALQAILGGIADELGHLWKEEHRFLDGAGNREEARSRAVQACGPALSQHLADSLTGVLRLGNALGISLEEAYLARMRKGESTDPR